MGSNGTWGRAGTGLADSTSWAVSATAAAQGAKYEEKTAIVLDRFADRAAILHDVIIPGLKANIDHVVVSGNRVLLIDTKSWRPGFYWTFGGKSRRGFDPVPHVDSKTMTIGHTKFSSALRRATLVRPVTVVWPSNQRKTMWLWALRLQGSRAIHAQQLERAVDKFIGAAPADPAIVTSLVALLARPVRADKVQAPKGW